MTGRLNDMKTPFIEFIDVKKKFASNPVMRGVNLSIFKEEITAIIGKSGCGKSVLLKHIIGLMKQDSGRILISGEDLSTMGKRKRRSVKSRFSYMFQDNALFDSLTVFENIALPMTEKSKLKEKDIRNRVEKRMEQLELMGTQDKFPAQLSGGMKKRVALARALVTDPDVVLFDEPTTGLDPIRRNGVHAMIRQYQELFGFTGVIVSHEIPEIFQVAQRVAMLDEGKIIFQGTSEAIQQSDSKALHSFINGKGDFRDL